MDRNILYALEASIGQMFDVDEWTQQQHLGYTIMRNHIHNYKEKNKKFEIKDDRLIIRNNLKDQLWFGHSKSKPIISQLLDSMSIVNYVSDINDYCINFILVISFGQFKLYACLYQNNINNFMNFYIYFENDNKNRAYLAYYTMAPGMELNVNMKKLKLPEFDKIYQVTGLNSQIFYQYDLLNFFSEIIMYYEESGSLGDIQISHGVSITLNQLIDKYNDYVDKKMADNAGYVSI